MKKFASTISHLGDILAIPFFILLFIYFYNIENKTPLEYVLLLFSAGGAILDSIFTYFFMENSKSV